MPNILVVPSLQTSLETNTSIASPKKVIPPCPTSDETLDLALQAQSLTLTRHRLDPPLNTPHLSGPLTQSVRSTNQIWSNNMEQCQVQQRAKSKQIQVRTAIFQNSFFPSSVVFWNKLPQVVNIKSCVNYKSVNTQVCKCSFQLPQTMYNGNGCDPVSFARSGRLKV